MPSHFQATNPVYVGGRTRTFHIFVKPPDPGSEPYLQPTRAWSPWARNVTHRFRIVYRTWGPAEPQLRGSVRGCFPAASSAPWFPSLMPSLWPEPQPNLNRASGSGSLPSFPWPHAATFLWRGPSHRRICSSNLLRITQRQVHFISFLAFLCIVFLLSHVSPPMVQNWGKLRQSQLSYLRENQLYRSSPTRNSIASPCFPCYGVELRVCNICTHAWSALGRHSAVQILERWKKPAVDCLSQFASFQSVWLLLWRRIEKLRHKFHRFHKFRTRRVRCSRNWPVGVCMKEVNYVLGALLFLI